ncbi:hypothetical protein Acj9p074 [Acinetobacter phage Acj9]|uniref:Uncharacterized protein n=1 Tax=Acinetobacter phage Acj9 TaxID=760939 RepID=E5EPK8_9CAUD|nr:hypothetical protein Acj9p074 [Acinetobacter phage Acj9]ADG59974.1 conserved hypothetical protein [Acinetobacter phage Acj9]
MALYSKEKIIMKPLIVGSVALAYHLDKLGVEHNLKPIDIDLIVDSKDDAEELYQHIKQVNPNVHTISILNSHKFSTRTRAIKVGDMPVEITHPQNGIFDSTTTADLVASSVYFKDRHFLFGIECTVAPLDVLYTLKMSHRFLKDSPHFAKTVMAIHNLRRCKAKIWDEKWLKRREAETYDYSHPKLSVSKQEFFTSNFDYVYDHDSIHEAVKLLDRPAYTFYMAGDAEVNCSKEAFFAQERTVQLLGVLEETYVLALERSQIPTNFSVDPRVSFMIALEKVCTSITSGWFREFAWENYFIVARMYDSAYVDKFKHALAKGQIKPFNGE